MNLVVVEDTGADFFSSAKMNESGMHRDGRQRRVQHIRMVSKTRAAGRSFRDVLVGFCLVRKCFGKKMCWKEFVWQENGLERKCVGKNLFGKKICW